MGHSHIAPWMDWPKAARSFAIAYGGGARFPLEKAVSPRPSDWPARSGIGIAAAGGGGSPSRGDAGRPRHFTARALKRLLLGGAALALEHRFERILQILATRRGRDQMGVGIGAAQ